MQVRVADRCVERFGKRDAGIEAVRHRDPAAGDDHRELRLSEQLGRRIEARASAGAALDADRLRDLAFDLAVEEIARDVQLRRTHLEDRAIERARSELGHPRRIVHVRLVLGDLREDRQLVGLLEPAKPIDIVPVSA
jgi:hypothetical protein